MSDLFGNPFGNPFGDDDLLGRLFGGARPGTPAYETDRLRRLNQQDVKMSPSEQPKPLPQIRGKEFDGVLYLRADDVLAALEATGQGQSPLAQKLRARKGK